MRQLAAARPYSAFVALSESVAGQIRPWSTCEDSNRFLGGILAETALNGLISDKQFNAIELFRETHTALSPSIHLQRCFQLSSVGGVL